MLISETTFTMQPDVDYGIYFRSSSKTRNRMNTWVRYATVATYVVDIILFVLWLHYEEGGFMTRFLMSCLSTVAAGTIFKHSIGVGRDLATLWLDEPEAKWI